ncbi:nicotinate-nucleotide--dimethylbenzimidazole phosphoribosyltransferase [Ornithinimicrobium ciconiae]|uniref:nicotinate-nucleotide--dimethylbenzimidazole phosphoribosyltransferase n=1 Tax=Ornithinimicrobium ciconiae TaxID=2594265 RepID=UPI001D193268|nr:nicotinate-nucleotide--dimethylbenzimidazole phosphoribosyltransferase [Ornithinimicrobium ciconiae]
MGLTSDVIASASLQRIVRVDPTAVARRVGRLGSVRTTRSAPTPPGAPTLSGAHPAALEEHAISTATVPAPSAAAREQSQLRLAALATPPGALGRLGDIAVWLSSTQGQVPPIPLTNVRLVIFAGDHGVAQHGVSAFPPEITGAMVRTFLAGRAGVSALARTHDVHVRVLDLGCTDDFADLEAGVRADLQAHKVRRGSEPIHLADALTQQQYADAWVAGETVAREELGQGADLVISGDMGIGNTTPTAALVAAALALPGSAVAGRGTGVDDAALTHKAAIVDQALARLGDRTDDPAEALRVLGSADLVATTAFLVTAARAGVPALLDGLIGVACGLLADRIAPGAAAWFAAGHRSPEPGQSLALQSLGLSPLLDLGMRLGEGSGAVAAVPLLHSAVALLRDVALLEDLG